jgi:hypothetical protein
MAGFEVITEGQGSLGFGFSSSRTGILDVLRRGWLLLVNYWRNCVEGHRR